MIALQGKKRLHKKECYKGSDTLYVTDGSDRTNACLRSVLRLSVDKGQV